MKTLVQVNGIPELILDKAVETGLASNKTDAFKMGLLELNNKYKLVEDYEEEMIARKLDQEVREMKEKGIKYIPLEEVLKKYKSELD